MRPALSPHRAHVLVSFFYRIADCVRCVHVLHPAVPAGFSPSARQRRPGLSGRTEPGAAQGGGDHGGSGAGARRRGDRQDPGADHAPGPYPGDRQGLAEPDPGCDLHQQGRPGDEAPGRVDHRRGGGGPALAWHLPLHLRPDPAPACRAGGPEAELHHPGHRRSAAPDQADSGSGKHRRQALDAALFRLPRGRLEEPGHDPGPHPGGRQVEVRRRQGGRSLQALSGAAFGPERL